MSKTLEEILNTEGIVIRKIPLVTVSHWRSSEAMHNSHKARGGEVLINDSGREVMVERKENSLGGKYLVTFSMGQDSIVKFQKGLNCGIGDSIIEAYENFFKGKHYAQ